MKDPIKIVENIVRKFLREDTRSGYYISYYATVGEHGETGKFYTNFKSALADATANKKDPDFMDGLEYLGVEPYGDAVEFAILYVEERYINKIADSFDDEGAKSAWIRAAKAVAQNGRPKIGKFPQSGK